jgi:hypothetical protein
MKKNSAELCGANIFLKYLILRDIERKKAFRLQ